jgi:hypothetical protein
VLELYPKLETETSESEEAYLTMGRALQEAWNALPNSLFESLVENMPKGVNACYKAKGWHTKY